MRQREEREEMVRQQAEELKKQLKKQEDMEKELNELRHKTPRPNHSGRPTLTKITKILFKPLSPSVIPF